MEEHANFALLLSHSIPREEYLCNGMSVYSYCYILQLGVSIDGIGPSPGTGVSSVAA